MNYLCITVRWIDDRYHGKDADEEPEWPPSPLRLFQALLASAYRRHGQTDSFLPSFRWLQTLREPEIVAPRAKPRHPFLRFVPNNDSDKVLERQNRLAEKRAAPTLLLERLAIHYIWQLPESLTEDERRWAGELCQIARSVVVFGWGVDMAVAAGTLASEEYLKSLPGERWLPERDATDTGRRVPCSATVCALIDRYRLFVNRLRNGCFSDPPPLDESAFRVVGYRRACDPPQRLCAAFSILRPDFSGYRAFDTTRKAFTVAGMTRCAAKLAAQRSGGEWTEDKINAFILGHGDGCGDMKQEARQVPVEPRRRFAYLPLPTLEWRGEGKPRVAGSVRRVMLTCFAEGCKGEITRARRMLSGQELIDEKTKQPAAFLSVIPENDKVVRCYTQRAATWATVTPVVLPGYDDPGHYRRRLKRGTSTEEQKNLLNRLDARIESLLRKAITQAGFSQQLADHAELVWRKVGFWPGADLADRYGVPDHLKRFPRFHVKLRWCDTQGRPIEFPGPVCLGGGRFYGLGLFAAL